MVTSVMKQENRPDTNPAPKRVRRVVEVMVTCSDLVLAPGTGTSLYSIRHLVLCSLSRNGSSFYNTYLMYFSPFGTGGQADGTKELVHEGGQSDGSHKNL